MQAVQRKREGGAGVRGGRRVVWVGSSLSGVQGLQSGHNAGTRDAGHELTLTNLSLCDRSSRLL